MTFGKAFLVGGRAAPAIERRVGQVRRVRQVRQVGRVGRVRRVGQVRRVGWVRQVGQKNRGNRPLYRKKILTLYFIITN